MEIANYRNYIYYVDFYIRVVYKIFHHRKMYNQINATKLIMVIMFKNLNNK